MRTVCQIADSEECLTKVINVANRFAVKWEMSFHTKKSKVVVVGILALIKRGDWEELFWPNVPPTDG